MAGATIIHIVYFDLYDPYLHILELTFLFCILISFPLFYPNVASKYGIVFGDAATKEGSHIDNRVSLLPRHTWKREDPGNEVVTFSSRKKC